MTSKPTLPRGYAKPKYFPLYTLKEAKRAEKAVALEKLPRELVPALHTTAIPPLIHLCYIVEEQDYPSLRKYAQQQRLEVMSVMMVYRLRQPKDIACDDMNKGVKNRAYELVDGGEIEIDTEVDETEDEPEDSEDEVEDEVNHAYEEVTLKTFDAFGTLRKILETPHNKERFRDLCPQVALVVNPNQDSNTYVAVSLFTNYAIAERKPQGTQGPGVFEEWFNSEVLQRSKDCCQRPCWRLDRGQCRWVVGIVEKKRRGAKS